ncbi:MAG: peptide deformylase [bacterium]|nr:peptide deformylase [bacterium]
MLKIVSVPNTILTTPTKSITSFDGSLQNLISEMKETLNAQTDPQGVGLAATQIGKDISLFIMKPKIKGEITAIVNPIILETSIERKKSKKSKIDPKPG